MMRRQSRNLVLWISAPILIRVEVGWRQKSVGLGLTFYGIICRVTSKPCWRWKECKSQEIKSNNNQRHLCSLYSWKMCMQSKMPCCHLFKSLVQPSKAFCVCCQISNSRKPAADFVDIFDFTFSFNSGKKFKVCFRPFIWKQQQKIVPLSLNNSANLNVNPTSTFDPCENLFNPCLLRNHFPFCERDQNFKLSPSLWSKRWQALKILKAFLKSAVLRHTKSHKRFKAFNLFACAI